MPEKRAKQSRLLQLPTSKNSSSRYFSVIRGGLSCSGSIPDHSPCPPPPHKNGTGRMPPRKEIRSPPEKAITEEEPAGSMSRSPRILHGLKQATRPAPDRHRGRKNGKSSSRVDEITNPARSSVVQLSSLAEARALTGSGFSILTGNEPLLRRCYCFGCVFNIAFQLVRKAE